MKTNSHAMTLPSHANSLPGDICTLSQAQQLHKTLNSSLLSTPWKDPSFLGSALATPPLASLSALACMQESLLRSDVSRLSLGMQPTATSRFSSLSSNLANLPPMVHDNLLRVAIMNRLCNASPSAFPIKIVERSDAVSALRKSTAKHKINTTRSGGFPLPSLHKAKKSKDAALLSYKVLWDSSKLSSVRSKREFFSRRLDKGEIIIVDRSKRLGPIHQR